MKTKQEWLFQLRKCTSRDTLEKVIEITRYKLPLSESEAFYSAAESLFRILCKYLFSEVAVQAVTELDNKAAHCHTPVPQWHRPFL